MKTKLIGALVCTAFMVGFGLGGYFGLSSLWGHASGWIAARSWQPVPAQVLHADLESRRDADGESTGLRVTAVYRYTLGGQSYEATQVGLVDSSDSIGDWNRAQHQRLDAARVSGEPVTAWVNSDRPQQALLDRGIRWEFVAFMIPFATLFPLVSLGALAALVHLLKTPTATIDEPEKVATNAAEIRSGALVELRGAWAVSILWGLIAFPAGFIFIPAHFGRDWLWLLVLLFPAVGVGLIVRAARLTHSYWRLGETRISLSPAQPALGAGVSVRVRFDKPPPEGEFTVALLCEKVDRRGDSVDRKALWRGERIGRAVGLLLEASFVPPAALPHTEPEEQVHHRWLVRLDFPPGTKAQREFEVVFIKAAPGARLVAQEAEGAAGLATKPRPIPATVARIEESPSGLRVAFRPAFGRGAAFGTLVLGAAVVAIAVRLYERHAYATFYVGATGLAILAIALYAFRHRFGVNIAGGRVVTESRGIVRTAREDVAVGDVLELRATLRNYDYEIFARLKDGRRLDLSEGVGGTGVTQALLDLFRRHLGLTESRVGSLDRAGTPEAPTPADVARLARGRRRLIWVIAGLTLLMALGAMGPMIALFFE